MHKLVFTLLILAVALAACTPDVSQSSPQPVPEVVEDPIVCEPPYMRHADGCCLDRDNNSVCDVDERPTDSFAVQDFEYEEPEEHDESLGEVEFTGEVSISGDPIQGDFDAPVTFILFCDYEDPFCGRFYEDVYGELYSEYVAEDLVKFVYRDFPLSFHPRAQPAAIAAQCVFKLAGDDAYFNYFRLLFENSDQLSDANLRGYAVRLNINSQQWLACYEDEETLQEVQLDIRDGQAAGVSGTPTAFVNGNKIVGAQPYAVFKAAIEAQLR